MNIVEKCSLRPSIVGWHLNPHNRDGCPLLQELCGGNLADARILKSEHRDLAAAIAFIKDVARSLGVTVQVCGNLKRNPTLILRRRQVEAAETITLCANLKHCVFAGDIETWRDHGHESVVSSIEGLAVGQTLVLHSTPSRESRLGRVSIERRGTSSWVVNGYVACPWDDAAALAESLNVLLQERGREAPPDADKDLKCFLEAYNQAHSTAYVDAMPLGRFLEVTPMSQACDGLGTEWDFSKHLRGDTLRVLRYLDEQEAHAIKHDAEEWSGVESYFSGGLEA